MYTSNKTYSVLRQRLNMTKRESMNILKGVSHTKIVITYLKDGLKMYDCSGLHHWYPHQSQDQGSQAPHFSLGSEREFKYRGDNASVFLLHLLFMGLTKNRPVQSSPVSFCPDSYSLQSCNEAELMGGEPIDRAPSNHTFIIFIDYY